MVKRGRDSAFGSFLTAYAWCALRRCLRHLLRREVGAMACVVLEDIALAGFFENAADILMSGKASMGGRREGVDFVAHKVSDRKSSLTRFINDLEYRRSLFLFASEQDVPRSLRASCDVYAVIGQPDASLIKGAIFKSHGVKIIDEDAAFLTSVPLADVAIALRRGVPPSRGIGRLRRDFPDDQSTPDVMSRSIVAASRHDKAGRNRLEELHGYGAAIKWGLQFCKDIEDFKKGRIGWESIDRGLLLYGPPGSGKTRFARELAKACDVPLFAHSYAEWQAEGHQGDMLKAMRRAFKNAADNAPCILQVDEIDTFTIRTGSSDNSNYNRGVVNGLLECLDGLGGREGVVVLATTNQIDAIDPAVLRSGRIDTLIELTLPDEKARKGILEQYLGFEIEDEYLAMMLHATDGFSGADLEVLARSVHRRARSENSATAMSHLLEVLPQSHALPHEVLWPSAIHEAGHVIVGLAVGRSIVSARLRDVVQQSRQLHQVGVVTFAADGIRRRTQSELLGELLICLAGMAAEIELFERHGTGSSGAEMSDLSMATNLATRIEAVHGMGQALVSETCDELELRRLRLTNPVIWQRVDAMLKESLETARAVVRDNRPVLEALAEELIRSKSLSGEDINSFFETNSIKISMNSLRFPQQ